MSVSILVIGDLHFTERSVPITEKLTPQVLKIIKDRSPDYVVVLGDILDRFGKADVQLQSTAVRFLRDISLLVPLLIIIGNHDIPNKTMFMTSDHGFSAVKYWDNVTIADISCVTIKVKGLTFAGVPYVPNGRFQEALDTADTTDVRAIFAHQEFKGCEIKGNLSCDGDRWEINKPLVISGHIHNHQWPQSNLCYVGTPYNENFGEKDIKSISMFTFYTENSSFKIASDSCDFNEERIYLDLPRRIEYTCKAKNIDQWKLPKGVIAKLRIVGTVSENIAVKKFSTIKNLKSQGVTIVYEDIIDTTVRENIAIEMLDEKSTPGFTEIMLSLVGDKDYLKSIYNEIFIH